MTSTLSVGEVTALLLDERFYSNSLRPKTFYKLLYFADKELSDVGLDTDIQHFWYKFGTMVKTGVRRPEKSVAAFQLPRSLFPKKKKRRLVSHFLERSTGCMNKTRRD